MHATVTSFASHVVVVVVSAAGPTPNERRKQRALESLKVLESRLREISLTYEREDEADVVGAFVTFQNKESADRCRWVASRQC